MVSWLTLAVAAIAAAASGFSAWRSWANWRGDQRNTRFERVVERALSADPRTSNTGLHQVVGMHRRGELSEADEGYLRDTVRGILDLEGLPPDLTILADSEASDDDGDASHHEEHP